MRHYSTAIVNAALSQLLSKSQRLGRCRLINLLCALYLISLIPTEAIAAQYSIKFSKKHQMRTGMVWLQHKPELIKGKLPRRWTEDPESIEPVSEELMSATLPYSAVGKLFFTDQQGRIGSCSGSFSGDGLVVATAAHCVMTGRGDWNNDFIFVRAYGSEAHEIYAIECVAVPAEWGDTRGDHMLNHDYAFLRTTRRSKGGSLGMTNGQPPSHVRVIGYSDTYAEGRKLVSTVTSVLLSDEFRLGSEGNHFGMGNSGAPWLDLSTVYSVSSYYNEGDESTMWGPRMSGKTSRLMTYVSRGCAQ